MAAFHRNLYGGYVEAAGEKPRRIRSQFSGGQRRGHGLRRLCGDDAATGNATKNTVTHQRRQPKGRLRRFRQPAKHGKTTDNAVNIERGASIEWRPLRQSATTPATLHRQLLRVGETSRTLKSLSLTSPDQAYKNIALLEPRRRGRHHNSIEQ